MVLSATNTGLVEDTRWWSETNTYSYPTADITRNLNKWYQELTAEILTSMDEWDFQGEIATASLVANQQEYTWPTNLLRVKRIEVSYGAEWRRVHPIDVQEVEASIATQSNVNNEFTTSDPRYDVHDNSIFLFPVPTSSVSGGLKIWYEKEVTELTSNTDEPNLAEPFHRLLSLGAAYDYATKKGLPIATQLLQKLEQGRAKLREFYNTRVPDRELAFGVNIGDYN